MSFPNMIFYLSLFILQILPLISSDTSQCTLTGFQSKDPYPSLITCYKYNNEACCLSVHDDYIKDQLSSMLTDSCLGKYNELEDLMCLGCHPFEMEYISTNEKGETVLTICKDFVKRLWDVSSDEDLNKTTSKYDNCGFKSEYFNPDAGSPFIIPSKYFTSVYHFLNNFTIPFYEHVKIEISDDNNNCYNYQTYLKINFFILLTMVIIIY